MTYRALHDEGRIATLLGALPPAPAAWVAAAQELPSAQRELDTIPARAEADQEFRAEVVADLDKIEVAEQQRELLQRRSVNANDPGIGGAE